ncbi:LytTR family DNA-binding domain-containing protein [Fusibacter sp. 3D3]|uniref:LytR/AlgR family response regulator transcription factor n=1 Tax=Fusibacter sp. 3D3 TaxID=1048380 RepID=UPI000853B835|nr:LytTR family DNA-binding domain-containing protein [Fusibacter sp. 3D3]GAU79216.1 two-component response regulator [Fusibacter sp. 3D3]
MLKIAICDDQVSELSNIINIINAYKEMNIFRYDITYTAFQNAVELISAIEEGNQYAIILLDIIMPSLNGMDAAREIRRLDQVAKIIFLTSSPEFAVDSYTVDAFYYALKPIWKEKLFAVLDKVLSTIQTQHEASLLVKCKTGLTHIPLHTLEYVEICGRTVYYNLINGIVLEEINVISKLEKVLFPYSQFVKPHRSFIVNLDYIDVLTTREIRLYSNATIPVSKANYTALKARYIEHTFQRTREKTDSLL